MISKASPDNLSNTIVLLVLSQIPGLGPARINAIRQKIGCSPEIFMAGESDFASIPGIGQKLGRTIARFFRTPGDIDNARKTADRQISLLERYNAKLVTIEESLYPPLLREIYDPPPFVFVRGDIHAAHLPSLSIVGTRQATQYGKKAVEHICRGLVSAGFSIVSGLAYGIDMTAHRSALDNNGKTIAVLAGGVENVHTDPEGKIWPRIIEQGALLSEEFFESSISPAKFPKRNRLISGLSKGTLIIESNRKGGALITSSYALDQNREVFAIPGSIFSHTSAGTNSLIGKGHAKLVTKAEDIISELAPGCSETVPETMEEHAAPSLSTEEKVVLNHLENGTVHIDTLAEQTAMDPSTLLVYLFELEMKNLVIQQPGQLFRRIG